VSEPAKAKRRRWLSILLASILSAELMVGGLNVWPVAAAKWRASPERLHPAAPSTRPANWAQPLSAAGLKNFHQVSPGLYRGARPTPEGIRSLGGLGVRTVVNLEVFHSDRDMLAAAGMDYVPISFKAWSPETKDMVAFLKVLGDANLAPVFVHCQYGSDRTGTMCALYRIAVQGWSKQAAIDEMTRGGFGFHPEWQHLLEFLDKLDVPAVKKQAGVEP
jgi:protein tyrosine phosphatase (PTP) superfamily phosphohydrolase (DUF442 family)